MAMTTLQHPAVAERISRKVLVLLGTLMYVKIHAVCQIHTCKATEKAILANAANWWALACFSANC